jgi:Na+-translocating ferredoxin:NAD+ oxidoreductase RnfA subunit
MTEFLLLLIGTVLVNNFVLVQFLGLCPFMGVSGKLETAIGMSMAAGYRLFAYAEFYTSDSRCSAVHRNGSTQN